MRRRRKAITLYDDYYEMIADKVRMDSYRRAIFEIVRRGDVVVDLGAGLGVLSFFALQAGASKVYAIEKADSAALAEEIAALNGFGDRMVFVRENSKDARLPEKADVLISETLGSFAVDENTLDFTIDARKRLVKENVRMAPQRIAMWLVPVEAPAASRKTEVWDSVYGIDFSPAKDEMLSKLLVEEITPDNYLSAPKIYKDIDLRVVEEATIKNGMTFEAQRAGTLHGFAGWFKCWLTPGISIDTSPAAPKTHWRQAFFPARKPVRVGPGSVITLEMTIGPKTADGDDTRMSYRFGCFPGKSSAGRAGRNDPCPCGSGRKYKKCCMLKQA